LLDSSFICATPQKAENRTTRSWDVSIRNSILEIQDLNATPSSKGTYLERV